MSSQPDAPNPIIVKPPKVQDLTATYEQAAESAAAKEARRRRQRGTTLMTGASGLVDEATVGRQTLGG